MCQISSATETVQGFPGLRALVIGDAMLDTWLEGEAIRLCKEAPVPVVREVSTTHCPGGAANTAVNLAALGAEVAYVAFIGSDQSGQHLREAFQAEDRKSTRLNSSHANISYAVFCLKHIE